MNDYSPYALVHYNLFLKFPHKTRTKCPALTAENCVHSVRTAAASAAVFHCLWAAHHSGSEMGIWSNPVFITITLNGPGHYITLYYD